MITIKHPTLPTTRQVKSSQAAEWVKAGWVRVPKKDAEAAESKTTPRVEPKAEAKTEATKK